tara:strand:+ start:37859 stop:38038 length:180 start_codon:yes stop_codon:yes gene_type:complete
MEESSNFKMTTYHHAINLGIRVQETFQPKWFNMVCFSKLSSHSPIPMAIKPKKNHAKVT